MVPIKNRLLNAAEITGVDVYTINTLGIPGSVLMEQAGMAVAKVCEKSFKKIKSPRSVVICGPGNNGGDGYVVARHLTESGAQCEVFLLGDAAKVTGDARLNLEIWQRLGHKIRPFGPAALDTIAKADLIVDAMLGTGAKGALQESFRKAAKAINNSPAKVVAVDLPTGIDADTGAIDADAVRADHTVTFGALKIGHVFSPGRECAGKVTVADIGFPAIAFEHVDSNTFILDKSFVATLLPKRNPAAFKNRCGQVLVVAGSTGMDGAAALCSKSALVAGAGLVILAAPAQIANTIGSSLYEVMKLPLATHDGMISVDSWSDVEQKLAWADVAAVGPGLGQADGPREIVAKLIEQFDGLLIIDADGLNVLAGNCSIFKKRKGETILTPHPGEFSRLTGFKKEQILSNPVQTARDFAQKFRIHLLLKGAPSVASLPDGRVFVNGAGNPGMATAGMGDVLTGVVAGLGGQVENAEKALLLGMFVHSLSGDLTAAKSGEIPLTAGNVLDFLPAAFQELGA
ncbi:MAG: NAD(P)H-hydrate dehydratase [bacterium]